jgi:hypothetical protein
MTFVKSLELTAQNTWQQLLKRKREKSKEKVILRGESVGYDDLDRQKTFLV